LIESRPGREEAICRKRPNKIWDRRRANLQFQDFSNGRGVKNGEHEGSKCYMGVPSVIWGEKVMDGE
jgi:hypothetical protein